MLCKNPHYPADAHHAAHHSRKMGASTQSVWQRVTIVIPWPILIALNQNAEGTDIESMGVNIDCPPAQGTNWADRHHSLPY